MGTGSTNEDEERIEELIRQQRHAARRAGERVDQIKPLSDEELDAALPPADFDGPKHDPHLMLEGYTIARELNLGGQASVFEAIQESTHRKVAIKVIIGGPYISSSSRARFEREVKILASLDHPGIVRIVDRGRTADGSCFLVMDYIDGLDLDDYLAQKRGQISQREVVELFIKIVSALEAAHEQGIVHRDIKPGNIRIDRHGEPHILDFGLAGLQDEEHFGRTITRTGNIVGSMPWASPEQASGRIRSVGVPSDIYSLAVVLYQALTGQFPYPVSGMLQEIVSNISNRAPAPPEKVRDATFGPVDGVLCAIVLKGLAKAPEQRFQSARELKAELNHYLRGTSLFRMPRKRRQIYLAVLLIAIAASGAGWELRQDSPRELLKIDLVHSFNSIGMEFIHIPNGSFWMGSIVNEEGHDSDEQHHIVEISTSLQVGATEVTRHQYKTVMGKLPEGVPDDQENLPVDRVLRADAMEFCRRLSAKENRIYRLPTEAEWEYACRAGTNTPYAGNGRLADIAWYSGNSHGQLHPVKTRQPNHWGLYDMEGNVSEWCLDGYVPHLGGDPKTDPMQLFVGTAIARGGNALGSALSCRAASRKAIGAHWVEVCYGFRVVIAQKSIPEK